MRTVIVVGTGRPWREEKKPGEEIWGVNFAFVRNPVLDRLYFFDTWERLQLQTHTEPYWDTVNELGVECWSVLAHSEVPKCRAYPLREVVQEFGLWKKPWDLFEAVKAARFNFTCTIAYMVAHACLEHAKGRKVDRLVMHQILISPGSREYYGQKEAIDFWLGVATGLGIEVEISENSWLIRSAQWLPSTYGFEERRGENEYSRVVADTVRTVHADILTHRVPRTLTAWGEEAIRREHEAAAQG